VFKIAASHCARYLELDLFLFTKTSFQSFFVLISTWREMSMSHALCWILLWESQFTTTLCSLFVDVTIGGSYHVKLFLIGWTCCPRITCADIFSEYTNSPVKINTIHKVSRRIIYCVIVLIYCFSY